MRPLAALPAVVLLLAAASGWAEEKREPLPDPLSLAEALRLAGTEVPTLVRATAKRETAEAAEIAADSLEGTQVTLVGALRAVKPSYKSPDDSNNDSRVELRVKKRLYDFGYSDALQSAAGKGVQASAQEMLDARQQKTLDIMRAFFDVLLADLEYARDNEDMAVAYVAVDKARDRNELGQLSDVELLKAEAEYEEVRRRRLVSEQRQRLSRSRLALAMGRPGELVSELESPRIELPAAQGGDFETFWGEVEKSDPRLRALQIRLDAAMENLGAARASESPVLSAELGAAVYNRNTSSTHPLGGGLLLEVPLYSGGGKDASIMQAQSRLTEAKAELLDARLQLRQDALQAWLDRDRLRSDLQAVKVVGNYRDLYLDRSRALYELEVRTDLGDAMSQISDVRLRRARIMFDWAMNEAKLRAMTGSLLEDKQ